MNNILAYLIQVTLTLVIATLSIRYLRTFLRLVLLDLCGTEDRAQFWTAFSNILLIGLPLILALNYTPHSNDPEGLLFEVLGKLGGNLAGMLLALAGIGFIVAFFALVAPKPPRMESK